MARTRVQVQGVGLDNLGCPVVMLLTVDEHYGKIFLPIWTGPIEATAIQAALSERRPPRPLTHELMKEILLSIGAKVTDVEIHHYDEYLQIYYAVIRCRFAEAIKEIDCRPSDAITLAIHLGVPIYVGQNLLEKYGIWPEVDHQKIRDAQRFKELLKNSGFNEGVNDD